MHFSASLEGRQLGKDCFFPPTSQYLQADGTILAEEVWWCQHKPSPPSQGFNSLIGLLCAGYYYDYLHLCGTLGFQLVHVHCHVESCGLDSMLSPLVYGRGKAGRDLGGSWRRSAAQNGRSQDVCRAFTWGGDDMMKQEQSLGGREDPAHIPALSLLAS